jgi:hypothetical protein
MKTKTKQPMRFEFTKVFTEETAAFKPGDTFEDFITFVELSSFVSWVMDVNAANAKGKLPYKVRVRA